MREKSDEMRSEKVWKKFLKTHWKMALVMVGGIIAAVVVALFVLLWRVGDPQGIYPDLLGQWTVGYCISFVLRVILWELVFVASWVVPAVLVVYFLWYKQLPEEELKDYEDTSRHNKRDIGGAFSFFVFLTWLIVVYVSGRWNLAFQVWTFHDWIYLGLAAIGWDLLIIAIPATIGVIWWLRHDTKVDA
jgi:chromate transport protein ChrA